MCNPDEEPTAVLSISAPGLRSSPAFCLGTVVIRPEEKEPSKGRILLLAISSAQGSQGGPIRSLQILASKDVRGCVYALVRMSNEFVAAAINTAVSAFISPEFLVADTCPLVGRHLPYS